MNNKFHVFNDQSYDSFKRINYIIFNIQHANEKIVVLTLDDECFFNLFFLSIELKFKDFSLSLYDFRHFVVLIWYAFFFKTFDENWMFKISFDGFMHSW